jgi:hypothetical protein
MSSNLQPVQTKPRRTVKTEKINTAIILSLTTFTGVFSAAAFSLLLFRCGLVLNQYLQICPE